MKQDMACESHWFAEIYFVVYQMESSMAERSHWEGLVHSKCFKMQKPLSVKSNPLAWLLSWLSPMNLFQSEGCPDSVSLPPEFSVSMLIQEYFVSIRSKCAWKLISFKPATTLKLFIEYHVTIWFIDLYKYWLLRHCLLILYVVQRFRWSSLPNLAEVDMLSEHKKKRFLNLMLHHCTICNVNIQDS